MSEAGAADRRLLSRAQPLKPQRWPRTQRRQARIRAALSKRQPDLTVVLENVHDPHNVSAILRSCDGVGVLRAHAVYTIEEPPAGAFARQTSASAAKWVEVDRHYSIAACYDQLRADGFTILVTTIGPESRTLFDWDLVRPVALVFGNEMRGVSEEARDLADGAIEIPMAGMVQSLNVSVACAVCLYEAFRQRMAGGDYVTPKLTANELRLLEDDWLRR
ncbi:MAG: RNA methyltransferase [Chloroflexi bacterium]|nr:RNA methyltransferase [Chloroflexota bacterium]